MQSVTITLPYDFQIPTLYETESLEKKALAMRIGALAVETLFSSIAEEIREEHNGDLVAQLEKKHIKKQETIEREKRILEESLTYLQAKIGLDDKHLSEVRHQVKEECRSDVKELLAEKDKQILQLREQLSTEFRSLQEKMGAVTAAAARQLGSQEKGKAGEVSIEELIKKAYGSAAGFDLISKGREAQAGDYHMHMGENVFLWEVKNYTRMVNKDEVEKLHRDMRSNPDAKLGIMVSLHSGIVSHTKAGDIDIDHLEDGRMILYISNLYKREDPVFYLQTLRPFFEVVERKKDKKEVMESDELAKLKSRTTTVQHLLRNHTTTLQGLHNNIVQEKRRADNTYAERIAFLQQANSECQNTLKALMSDDTATSPLTQTLNPLVYKKISMEDMTEKERKLVLWFQEHCEESPDHEIESKVLMEKLKDSFKERELLEARKVLQEDVWRNGGKKIRGFRVK
jgi:hypothetical protein